MSVTITRLNETDELFMSAYQAISKLRNNLEGLPQNKALEARMLLNSAGDDLITRLNYLREFDR